MIVRSYQPPDYAEWSRMRSVLFLGQTEDDMASWLARDDAIVLVAERTGGGLCGFSRKSIELSCT